MKNFKIFIVLAILAQFGILGGMIFHNSQPYREGKLITVKTEPVDPRDLFRGDYVVLNYDFNRPSDKKLESSDSWSSAKKGTPVYAVLVKSPDSEVWTLEKVTLTQPTASEVNENRLYIAGLKVSYWRASYGIEQFFVQEGKGKELEKATRNWSGEAKKEVHVDIYVTSTGQAAVKEARIVKNSESETGVETENHEAGNMVETENHEAGNGNGNGNGNPE